MYQNLYHAVLCFVGAFVLFSLFLLAAKIIFRSKVVRNSDEVDPLIFLVLIAFLGSWGLFVGGCFNLNEFYDFGAYLFFFILNVITISIIFLFLEIRKFGNRKDEELCIMYCIFTFFLGVGWIVALVNGLLEVGEIFV